MVENSNIKSETTAILLKLEKLVLNTSTTNLERRQNCYNINSFQTIFNVLSEK